MPRRTRAHVGAATVVLALLAGCSGDLGSIGPGAVPYQHANAIYPVGYSESQIAPDRYRIQVKGPLSTTRERLEKIAATRAAEIGKENRLGYFKIDGVQIAAECETITPGGKPAGVNGSQRTVGRAVLTADVSYTKSPQDQSYLDSKSFDQLRADLDVPPATPGMPAATAQCG
ncbi:hypothetical protein [uncultured Hyphomicrobium sp.]|uniref:CC0125/CC1285 family lipoprotein n=1 Tax=uncultured Hyphomicrobium sp. TaxID=194373 RepID=UPI0025F238C4|nr:hypothetical protein [uncultured Hyphomicrobium sp.]